MPNRECARCGSYAKPGKSLCGRCELLAVSLGLLSPLTMPIPPVIEIDGDADDPFENVVGEPDSKGESDE